MIYSTLYKQRSITVIFFHNTYNTTWNFIQCLNKIIYMLLSDF